MTDIKSIIVRCEDIIEEFSKILEMGSAGDKLPHLHRVNSSIENIYHLCYPKGIPSHLKLENLQNTLKNSGIVLMTVSTVGFFKYRLNSFKGFVEDLKKGLITSDLMSLLSIDIYNDMIDQAIELRKIKTESLNRAACVLSRIVLEDSLKKICSKHGIILKSNKANEANMELKRNTVYGNTQFKHVDTWLSIGNAAAHPKGSKLDFTSVTETQMDDMMKNIPGFINKYL